VVGAILDLTLFLGKAVIFPSGVVGLRQLDVISLVWALVALFLLQRFKWKIIRLILLGTAFGSIRNLLSP
jgi:chromate transporter